MRKLVKLGCWCLLGVLVSWLLVNAVPVGSLTSPTAAASVDAIAPRLSDRAIAQNRTRLGIPQDLDPATLPDFPSRDLQGASSDPADQIAPPGLLVRPGDAPISYFFGLRMEKELDSLVGRYESALFAANAASQPVEVQLPASRESVAVTSDQKDRMASTDVATVSTPALEAARQLKLDWPNLLATEAYGEARRRWLRCAGSWPANRRGAHRGCASLRR